MTEPTARSFPLHDILAVRTESVSLGSEPEGVIELLDHMAGRKLKRFERFVTLQDYAAELTNQYPELASATFTAPDLRYFPRWARQQEQHFGATLEVKPLGSTAPSTLRPVLT